MSNHFKYADDHVILSPSAKGLQQLIDICADNGFGVYVYDNKFFRYEGEWLNGKKHGHGKLIMADGSYYEGEFQDGEIEGHGFRYNSFSKSCYSGQFHLGEFQGEGVMKYHDDSVYEGEWHRNMREGYGNLRLTNHSIYQGYLHEHKRHGEGSQLYSDGSRYDGDWVKDKCQGHGELKYVDGTTYLGQWKNDVFSGQGVMSHCSGIVYEGMWAGGLPIVMASKLVIKMAADPLTIIQGELFSVEVVCQNEAGEVVPDMGRLVQISAGFQHFEATDADDKSKADGRTTVTAGIFDLIEDVDETPIETPFGYSIVGYPLIEQLQKAGKDDAIEDGNEHVDEELLHSRMGTSLAETTRSESPAALDDFIDRGRTPQPGAIDRPKTPKQLGDLDRGKTPTQLPDFDRSKTPTLQPAAIESLTSVTMPHVAHMRTDHGVAAFSNLLLPVAPPMYRPFIIQEANAKRNKSRLKAEDKSKARKAKQADELDTTLVRPGEYVITVQDLTSPSFMDVTLETAFMVVKVLPLVKKRKEKHRPVKKDKGPKWDTSQHIASAMVREYTDDDPV